MEIDKNKIELLKDSIKNCRRCDGLSRNGSICIEDKEVGLDYSYPRKKPINIMFVAESPPAPGKDFFYDPTSTNEKFKKKLFKLINMSGLGEVKTIEDFSRKGYYLADALNCRWDKTKGSSLSNKILKNCSTHLAEQIKLFQPAYIVAMGKYAQASLKHEAPSSALKEIQLPSENVIEMSFILVASNETDSQRIEKLKRIKF